MKIYDFVEWELEKFRKECNFSEEEMIDHLKEMMRNARTDDEREAYRKTIEQLQRYSYKDKVQ